MAGTNPLALALGLQLLSDALRCDGGYGAVLLVARPESDPVLALRATGIRLPGNSVASEGKGLIRPKVKDRELDRMVALAWAAGWFCDRTKSGHPMCYPPDQESKPVLVAGTPSDHRTIPNTRSRLRQSGLDIQSVPTDHGGDAALRD